MVAKLQKRAALRSQLQNTKVLARNKSVKKELWDLNAVKDVVMYISILKLKIEAARKRHKDLTAVRRELVQHTRDEVKVEKTGDRRFHVKVKCGKEEHGLVRMLEAFEEMGMDVLQARVLCYSFFAMEAIVMPEDPAKNWGVDDVTQALLIQLKNQRSG